MSDENTPSPDEFAPAKKRIEALAFNAVGKVLADGDTFVRLSVRAEIAQAVLAVVQPELDRHNAGTERDRHRWRARAEVAEELLAERDLTIEKRRLLAISRMVFDGIAEGRPIGRDEAADLAQRLVDEIGHSVTDEPVLGPSFRAEVEQLNATIAEFREYLDRDFRQWCSPHGIASDYATKLIAELDRIKARNQSDLPAVREFVAGFDPREEST